MPSRKQTAAVKETALEKFETQFLKDMGGTINHSGVINPYTVSSTGSLNLDYALGVGGYPFGRIIEVWGPEHAGKTSLCLAGVADMQRLVPDKPVAWIDMEQTLDLAWAQKLGVDLKRLWIRTPDDAEEVADATRRFVYSDLFSMVVLDSVGGMISRMEIEKEADEATVANVARTVTRMVKVASPRANKNGTTLVVVNQVRARIAKFGASETTSGGWALKHISTAKLRVQRGNADARTVLVEGKQVPVAHEVRVKVEKNKCAPYGKEATFWLTNQASDKWGPIGIDKVDEAYVFGKRFGLFEVKGGGYFVMHDGTQIRSEEKVREYLFEHPEEVERIRLAALDTIKDTILDEGLQPPDLPLEDLAEAEALDRATGEVVLNPDFALAEGTAGR